MNRTTTSMVDAISLEVMRNALQAIAEEMGVTLTRTALSPNIKDRRDCSTAIYTADGELVAQAEHIPLHLGLMPSVIKAVLKRVPVNQLNPEDAVMINDPYISGSHLPDVCVFTPVFHKGKLVSIVANLAHHVDVGGKTPGSMPVDATEIFQEGIRIPPIKIRKKGKIDEELLGLITNNVRTSYEMRGDIEAQLAANNIGTERLQQLFEKHGSRYVLAHMHEVMNYSERRMRAKIGELQNKTVSFKDYMENGWNKEDLIPIMATVTIKDCEVAVDFTGTAPQVSGSLNCTRAVTLACVYYAIKALLDPEIPSNSGAFRNINVITPEGTIVNPKFPAAVSNANINTAQRIADVVLGALNKLVAKKSVAASCGSMSNFTMGGIDSRSGQFFSYVETYGGGMGAHKNGDGLDGVHTNMTNTRNTPSEVMEIAYPVLVNKYGLVPDSEGPGKYRGGMGLTREVTILNDETIVTLSTERAVLHPWGIKGGLAGRKSLTKLIKEDGQEEILPAKVTMQVERGDRVVYQTPGAGGYGGALERDPLLVREDVLDGLVTVKRAKELYGVVFDDNMKVNFEATRELRKQKF